MDQDIVSIDSKVATVGGTLLTVFEHINPEDIDKTIILAVLGALVSFTMSLFYRLIWDIIKGKYKNPNKNENDE
jgi:hypothetical protein